MKKWITIDDIICSFVSSVAYGFGYSIPAALNAPSWLCLVICFGLGMLAEELAGEVIYNEHIQRKNTRRLLAFILFALFFIVCEIISKKILKSSLVGNLEEQINTTVIFAFIGFIISLCKKYYRYLRVKKRHGKGEKGYRFNSEEKEYIRSLDIVNKEIKGDYDTELAVKTRTGVFVGEKDGDVICFYGIPYAKPPVGKLRWKAPEKLDNCDKVYEAKNYSPSPIQVNYEGNSLSSHKQSENCLYLNVFTKNINTEEKKPVIVYIHGGDFTFGGAASLRSNMTNFVDRNDVVTVTYNFRLGLLGFIDFSDVPGGENYSDSCNLGMYDQIAAIEWIKENIEQFGGDPNNITLMGYASGGTSISLLGACDKADGLFNKAIIFSGNPLYMDRFNGDTKILAKELLKEAKVSSMKELLSLPESKIIELTQKLKEYLLIPTCDGKLFPSDIIKAYENGAGKNIHFVICMSKDNMNSYASYVGREYSMHLIKDIQKDMLSTIKPDVLAKLRKYLNEDFEEYAKDKTEINFYNSVLDKGGDCIIAEAISKGNGLVHLLYWNVESAINNFGTGADNIVDTVFNIKEISEIYGNVVDESIHEVLNTFIIKTINNKKLELYNNEIVGINEIDWKSFPYILTINTNSMELESLQD